jgi:hypothetical protein
MPLAQNDAGGAFLIVIWLAVIALVLAAWWKLFTKAGRPGWAGIVPIYNMIVLAEIVGRPWWWGLLPLVPCVGIVFAVILFIDLAKSFGQGVGFAIGLILLGIVFLPLLAFGQYQYIGPAAAGSGPRGFPVGPVPGGYGGPGAPPPPHA